ncbi:DUF4097 family beta strand repeat-containing protein [Rhodohalobacter sp. 614A]|uniref:DUF4097 family beta strand repeat-containing protein n=1 Tax=Rhodohalobacter sp. 614A TaxID=2908649 RepID=UPI001F2AC950|nr:DUF4097 family beta strand repeat-containing protein [Rhodohalobacter sp. 614A]
MKKSIKLIATVLLMFLVQQANAQEYRYDLGNSAEMTVEFSVGQSDVSIEGYDGSELVIENLDYEQNSRPERAEGLRALYYSAEDNTGIGLSVEEENGILKIIPASRDDSEYRVKIPNRVRLMIEQVNFGGGDFEISDHSGEIEIQSKTGNINLSNITGPVTASSVSGDVEIDFSQLSQANPTSISLVSGFIDITLPANASANFNLGSISGEVYTDLDIALEGRENNTNMTRLGGSGQINGTLNGGGVEVRLKSVSGDIYLRGK